jgi:hypothetical protein
MKCRREAAMQQLVQRAQGTATGTLQPGHAVKSANRIKRVLGRVKPEQDARADDPQAGAEQARQGPRFYGGPGHAKDPELS